MNVGELPHDKGFLVLDEVELQELFGVSNHECDALRFATVADRLSLAQISRTILDRCNGPRVQSALGLLAKRSLDHVRRLRRASPAPDADHRRGRAHAYYAMLHTNATLALERASAVSATASRS
jgi:hypothetical protein